MRRGRIPDNEYGLEEEHCAFPDQPDGLTVWIFTGPVYDSLVYYPEYTVQIVWLLIVTGILLFIQGFSLLGNKVLTEAGKPAAAAVPEGGNGGGNE